MSARGIDNTLVFSSPLFLILYRNLVLRDVAIPLEITEILAAKYFVGENEREGFLLKNEWCAFVVCYRWPCIG